MKKHSSNSQNYIEVDHKRQKVTLQMWDSCNKTIKQREKTSYLSRSLNIFPLHCGKSVQIRSFFWSVFSSIRTKCSLNLRIWSEYHVVLLKVKSKSSSPPTNVLLNFLAQQIFDSINFATKTPICFRIHLCVNLSKE